SAAPRYGNACGWKRSSAPGCTPPSGSVVQLPDRGSVYGKKIPGGITTRRARSDRLESKLHPFNEEGCYVPRVEWCLGGNGRRRCAAGRGATTASRCCVYREREAVGVERRAVAGERRGGTGHVRDHERWEPPARPRSGRTGNRAGDRDDSARGERHAHAHPQAGELRGVLPRGERFA